MTDEQHEQDALFDSPVPETELDQLQREYDAVRDRNTKLFQQLVNRGRRLNDVLVNRVKLDALKDYIFATASPEDRLEFEVFFEDRMTAVLTKAVNEAGSEAHRKLLLGQDQPHQQQFPDSPSGGVFIGGHV